MANVGQSKVTTEKNNTQRVTNLDTGLFWSLVTSKGHKAERQSHWRHTQELMILAKFACPFILQNHAEFYCVFYDIHSSFSRFYDLAKTGIRGEIELTFSLG